MKSISWSLDEQISFLVHISSPLDYNKSFIVLHMSKKVTYIYQQYVSS